MSEEPHWLIGALAAIAMLSVFFGAGYMLYQVALHVGL